MKTDQSGYALITGASSGLGKAFAIVCARRGKPLILLALPGSELAALGNYLSSRYKIEVVTFELDLSRKEELEDFVHQIAGRYPVSWLINNAGTGGTSRFEQTRTAWFDQLIKLNIRSTVLLTRMLLPEILQQGDGLILNVSSTAAFSPMAYKTIYPASKTFVWAFTCGLREEFRGRGIRISVVHPGPMLTNFDTSCRIMEQGALARISLLSPQATAEKALGRALAGQGVIVPGLGNKIQYFIMRLLPTAWQASLASGIVRRELGKGRPHSPAGRKQWTVGSALNSLLLNFNQTEQP